MDSTPALSLEEEICEWERLREESRAYFAARDGGSSRRPGRAELGCGRLDACSSQGSDGAAHDKPSKWSANGKKAAEELDFPDIPTRLPVVAAYQARWGEPHTEFIKVAFLGGGGIGAKSALVIRFVQRHFVECYDPTIEDSYRAARKVDGTQVQFEILDTAGQEEYSAMREQYMRTHECFVLGYSATSRQSFDELYSFNEQVARVTEALTWAAGQEHMSRIPRVLVGNKIDLVDDIAVPSDMGAKLAKELGNIPFLETSAKTGFNVAEVFRCVLRTTMEKRQCCPAWRFIELLRCSSASVDELAAHVREVGWSPILARFSSTAAWGYYRSPVISAIYFGSLAKVEWVMEQSESVRQCLGPTKAEAYECDLAGPLKTGIYMGRPRVVSLLLAHGANPLAYKSTLFDTSEVKGTSLHLAASVGATHCLRNFLERLSSEEKETALELNLHRNTHSWRHRCSASPEMPCTQPLAVAWARGKYECVRLLLQHNASPDLLLRISAPPCSVPLPRPRTADDLLCLSANELRICLPFPDDNIPTHAHPWEERDAEAASDELSDLYEFAYQGYTPMCYCLSSLCEETVPWARLRVWPATRLIYAGHTDPNCSKTFGNLPRELLWIIESAMVLFGEFLQSIHDVVSLLSPIVETPASFPS